MAIECASDVKELTGDFWLFRDSFESWSAPGSMTEVMTHSEFVFVVLSHVGWIHSWTKIMLLPLLIFAQ